MRTERAAEGRKRLLSAAIAPVLVLAALLAPLRAEASLTRGGAPSPAALVGSPPPAIERALDLEEAPAPEPVFTFFVGDELACTASESERAPSFHPLAAVSLLSKDGAEPPLGLLPKRACR